MLEKIGIREFRDNLAKYLNADTPIAVMRHGQTVGYFLPAQQKPTEAEIDGLKRAAEKLDALLQEKGLNEDILLREFRALREQER
jgi:antitoxin (DNA-binding transcriptional repressor) of toxin-antitoxin stability system